MSVCRQISIVASPNPPSADEAMADAKRARTELQNFVDFCFADVRVRDLEKKDDPEAPLTASVAAHPFNLTPSNWLTTKYGFDLNCKYGKPSFLGGPSPKSAKASESLTMRVVLDSETTSFLKSLDAKVSEEYAKIRQAEWQPLVSEDSLFGGDANVKIKVVMTGSQLTKLTLVVDGKVDRGEGWPFLKDYVDRRVNFHGGEIKACLRCTSVWYKDGKAGLSLAATRLVVRPVAAPPEVDPFGDDAELLA
jgi:hypothetical protein